MEPLNSGPEALSRRANSTTPPPARARSAGPLHLAFDANAAPGAFTLIELLLVVIVMVLIMTLVAPALNTLMESNNIARAGQMLSDQIKLARQTATSGNHTVEVRLIELPPLTGGTAGYNAIQLWTAIPPPLAGVVTYAPSSKMVVFPYGISISGSKLGVGNVSGMSYFLLYLSSSTIPAGFPTAGDYYVAFEIKPTGLINPISTVARIFPSMSQIYLTVVPARNAGSTVTTTPVNFATIQINPMTGSTLIYRP